MKTPLVLIHGFTGAKSVWNTTIPLLEPHHEVLALSLTGHAGGRPFDDGLIPSVAAAADALERDLDDAGIERAHLVGNSLGGWLALVLGARGRGLSVVAVSPAGGYEVPSREARRIKRLFVKNDLSLRMGRSLLDFVARRPRARALALREMLARPERLTASAARDMMQGALECTIVRDFGEALERDSYGDLGAIDCPARIAWAERDRVLPKRTCSERLRRSVPGAEWIDLPGVGHIAMVDDPELVARTVLEATQRVDAAAAAPSAAGGS